MQHFLALSSAIVTAADQAGRGSEPMGIEGGGRAAALGHLYERRYAVRLALYVVQGRCACMHWQPAGPDEPGVDIWTDDKNGRRTYYQLKRQNRDKTHWSISDLKDVLRAAKAQLERRPGSRFIFVSTIPVQYLRTLAEQSERSNDDVDQFTKDVIGGDSAHKGWADLLQVWGLNPASGSDLARAFRLLQRLEFETFEAHGHRTNSEFEAELIFSGTPSGTVKALGGLLEATVGNTIHADELLSALRKEGIQRRDLSDDPNVAAAIQRLQDAFFDGATAELIGGEAIERDEIDAVAAMIHADRPPGLVLLHGSHGCGKTIALCQIAERLRTSGTPFLPIQLHIKRPEAVPHTYGREVLGLPGSPVHSLRAVAAGRHAVLILDQLDALRQTSQHSEAVWEHCKEVIEDAKRDANMTVLIACRTFDMQNDPQIKAWRKGERPGGDSVREIELGLLPPEKVSAVLARRNMDSSRLLQRQRDLLARPSTLAIWEQLCANGVAPDSFASEHELLDKLRESSFDRACREHDLARDAVVSAVGELVACMTKTGRTAVRASLLPERAAELRALCSVGLLRSVDGQFTFGHQSYLDSIVADSVYREASLTGADPLEWIRGSQCLFKREQIRLLVALLRDDDPRAYASLLKRLFQADGIRFHVKDLTLGFVGSVDQPLSAETSLVGELAKDPEWRPHILAKIVHNRPGWFEALYAAGHLKAWLEGDWDDESIRELLMRCQSIARECGDTLDRLLDLYWEAPAPWPDRLPCLFFLDASADSERMFELRTKRMAEGEWLIEEAFLPEVARRRPDRIVPLLDAAFIGWEHRMEARFAGDSSEEPPRLSIRDYHMKDTVFRAIRGAAAEAWTAFAERLDLWEGRARHAFGELSQDDASQQQRYRVYSAITDVCEHLERFLVAAVEGLSQQSAVQVRAILDDESTLRGRRVERSIAAGLAKGCDELADDALSWLMARPERFRLGDNMTATPWRPACGVLERFALHATEPVFRRLESTILGYHDPSERVSLDLQSEHVPAGTLRPNGWGRAQNVLLSALPASRLSPKAKRVAAEWRRKFGDASKELPTGRVRIGGSVRSTIPADRVMCVSDDEWRRIVRGDWKGRREGEWSQLKDGVVGERSAEEFANALQEAARQDPARFVSLAMSFQDDVDTRYLTAVVRGVATGEASAGHPAIDAIVELLKHSESAIASSDYAMAMCSLLGSREDLHTNDYVISSLDTLSQHAHPRADEFTCHSGSHGAMKPDLAASAINCVRGQAAGVMRTALWNHPELLASLQPSITRLVEDGNPGVRHEAIGICYALLPHDRDFAVDLLQRAVTHTDDRVLSSRWVQEIIRQCRKTHLAQLAPIVERMARSTDPDVSQAGAAWAAAVSFDGDGLEELRAECRGGTLPQRVGVTRAAREFVVMDPSHDQGLNCLLASFEDDERDVRIEGATVFHSAEYLREERSTQLTAAFAKSKALRDDPHVLLWPLSEEPDLVQIHAEPLLHAAEFIATRMAAETRSAATAAGFVGRELSILMLRLYGYAYEEGDEEIKARCLDMWDLMLRARVGYIIESIDAEPR